MQRENLPQDPLEDKPGKDIESDFYIRVWVFGGIIVWIIDLATQRKLREAMSFMDKIIELHFQ